MSTPVPREHSHGAGRRTDLRLACSWGLQVMMATIEKGTSKGPEVRGSICLTSWHQKRVRLTPGEELHHLPPLLLSGIAAQATLELFAQEATASSNLDVSGRSSILWLSILAVSRSPRPSRPGSASLLSFVLDQPSSVVNSNHIDSHARLRLLES